MRGFSAEESRLLVDALLRAHVEGDREAANRLARITPDQLSSILDDKAAGRAIAEPAPTDVPK